MSATHTKIAIAANVPESFRMLLRAQLDHARANGFEVHCISGPGSYLQDLARAGFPIHEVPLTRLLRPAEDVRALIAWCGSFGASVSLWCTPTRPRPRCLDSSPPASRACRRS